MARVVDTNSYHVDLAELMRIYETNYAKLNRLIPTAPEVGDVRCYQAGSLTYQLEVREVTKYTTLVEIFQDDELPVFPLPKMTVRLYHDAKVAEVCDCENASRVQARYDYPNAKMHQKDEKFQFNQFLSDWLTFCLKNGISRAPIMYRS
ncbi:MULTISPECIES: DUF1249 family protein [Vibrio]|uniref:Cytoplasmic protein n=1 Tax=Vibrio maritimus TaxID=990268 RepID=A0A090SPM5_9VIBR|nr:MULTISPECIES: DUF1249 family protein [Vibrio]USD60842.1 DUF1249 family protein [Vibrio sp. SCSIO 43140]GAL21337.1 hypothetical protein JCM19235_4819 [Vibrio maritimus]